MNPSRKNALVVITLLSGFVVSWFLVGEMFVFLATYSADLSFSFVEDPPFSYFFRFSFGTLGAILSAFLTIKNKLLAVEKNAIRYLLATFTFFAISLSLTIIGSFSLWSWQWSTGDRDYFLPVMPYIGCGLGLFLGILVWLPIAIFAIFKKTK